MPNDYFEFSQFTVQQSGCSQKVSTDACLFGAWTSMVCEPTGYVLDIGAGTGLLMLMIAQKHAVEIDGIEIDVKCALQMKENLLSSPWSNRLKDINADVRTYPFHKKYNLVMSNPPFYEKQLQSPNIGKNLAWHSSELSLTELFGIATRILTEDGRFSLIIPHSRKQEAMMEGERNDLFAGNILTVRHTLNHAFTRSMIMFTKQRIEMIDTELEIRNEDGSYSKGFKELLAGYYLFL